MKSYTIYFNGFEGKNDCMWGGCVSVDAESKEEAIEKVKSDFKGEFTNIEVDEISEFDDEQWNVYINAKGKNCEYYRMVAIVEMPMEEIEEICIDEFKKGGFYGHDEIEAEEK